MHKKIGTAFILTGMVVVMAAAEAVAQLPKAFDVVSIKPDRDGKGLDVETPVGGRYNARNVTATFLLTEVFGVRDYQIVGAPSWVSSERYDIAAKIDIPNQIGAEQLKPLLQAMLTDRFRLKFHMETRQSSGYSLLVGKSGPKFLANTSASAPGLSISSNRAGARMTATRMPMSTLTKQLGESLGRPVADNTGLKGDFDFKLEWTPPETAVTADPSVLTVLREQPGLKFPAIFTAVQEQLGLKLEALKRMPVEFIVIDRMEKASEN